MSTPRQYRKIFVHKYRSSSGTVYYEIGRDSRTEDNNNGLWNPDMTIRKSTWEKMTDFRLDLNETKRVNMTFDYYWDDHSAAKADGPGIYLTRRGYVPNHDDPTEGVYELAATPTLNSPRSGVFGDPEDYSTGFANYLESACGYEFVRFTGFGLKKSEVARVQFDVYPYWEE